MIESIFRRRAVTAVITGFALLTLLIFAIILFSRGSAMETFLPLSIIVLLIMVVLFRLIWGELRTRAVSIKINSAHIEVTNFFGFGSPKNISLSAIDGFKISILPAEYKEYEYLYLMSGNRRVVIISEFYHRNYFDLKAVLIKKCRNLGTEKFNFAREIKKIFS